MGEDKVVEPVNGAQVDMNSEKFDIIIALNERKEQTV